VSVLPPPGTYGPGPQFTVHPRPNEPAGQLRPSKLWVVLASVLLGVGAIVGIVIVAVGIVRVINSVADCGDCAISRAGSYDIQPSRVGRYFIYIEGVTSKTTAQDRYDALDVTLTDPSGASVPISTYDNGFTLSNNNVDLVAVAQFRVTTKGTYRLTVDSNSTRAVRLRFGTVSIRDFARPIVVGVAVGGGLFLAGALMLIITLVRRSRARKLRQRDLGPPPGLTPWGSFPTGYRPPMPWGTPPLPPPGTWNPPR
jgi:hypothetical protein